ncbi:hypothetical protein [Streptosporangium sp. NPDC049046]|uniref:hypothetical protein n=1 Tax=Streptosporangium sp. NPDC049046 TaxID=3155031 RepID=UPI00341F27AA
MSLAESGMESSIGRLEKVSLRELWPHEVRHFTPWLWANPGELGRVLRMDLEWTDSEYPIGRYVADLIGTDRSTGDMVIVENQLDPGDHGHLGQLVTYMAGTRRATGVGVWIAKSFSSEHIDALNSLQGLGAGWRFFAVELRALRIGQSLPAPDFRVRAHPQGWDRR